MAKERGRNVLLRVGTGTSPISYTSLSGQRDTRMVINGQQIDISDKTSGSWGESLAANLSMQINVSGVVNWPDTNGWDELRQAAEANDPVPCRIVLNAAGSGYTVQCTVSNFETGGTHEGATEYSFTLNNFGQPVWAATGLLT